MMFKTTGMTYRILKVFLRTAAVLLLVCACFVPEAESAGKTGAASAGGNACSKDCSQVTKNCQPARNRNGIFVDSASHKINSSCVRSNAASGCFNGMPVSAGTGNYNSIGSRESGTRNHYGTDIGCSGYSNVRAFPVADHGKIAARVQCASGSGRTLVMNFEKKCSGGGGQHSGYHTVMRHLNKFLPVKNDADVRKNEAVGIVGGTSCCGGRLCTAYAPHLHLELFDGLFGGGSNTAAKGKTVLKPYCQDLNVLCGGCPSAKDCDDGSRGGGGFGTSSADDGGAGIGGDQSVAESSCHWEDDYLDNSKCVFCPIFKTMFNAASQIALMADQALLNPVSNLVKIGFLIWLAIYILRQFVSFNAASPAEMLKGLLFQGFRVAAVLLILSTPASMFYVMDLTLNPVMMTGLTFVKNLNPSSSYSKNDDFVKGIKGYDSEKGYAGTAKPDGGLSRQVGEAIVTNIKNLEDATSLLMKHGNYSVCIGLHDSKWWNVLPNLAYLTTGIFLWLAGIGLLLSFPWCLVDCILQLCIAAALVPCAVGAYAFKITSKYLKIVWDFFMNAMFNFVFMAIIVYIINKQLAGWLGMDDAYARVPDNKIYISFTGLAWYGLGFIRVAAICFFCYTFFDEAKSMAEKFASSPSLGGKNGIGRMVGGTVASASAVGGKAALETAGGAALLGGRLAGKGLNYAVGDRARNFRNMAVGKVASGGAAVASLIGRGRTIKGPDGTRGGSFRFLGKDITFTSKKGEDGKYELERTVHKRSQFDKAFEKQYDENGNVVKDENGHDVYAAVHRAGGIRTGKSEMTASVDENGNLVYTSEDGKSSFVIGEDGQPKSYETRATRLHPFKKYKGVRNEQDAEDAKLGGGLKMYGDHRVVHTATARTREDTDAFGNVTHAETQIQSASLFHRDLVRKDGSIDTDVFNNMQKNMKSPEQAAKVLVSQVMEKRGLKSDLNDKDAKIDIDSKGIVTIARTFKDDKGQPSGSETIKAQMMGDKMFISVEKVDAAGNRTLNESNGMLQVVQTLSAEGEYNIRHSFSDQVMKQNKYIPPLNSEGKWGNGVDRDAAMTGFTAAHFEKIQAQLKDTQAKRTMSTLDYRKEIGKDGTDGTPESALHKQFAMIHKDKKHGSEADIVRSFGSNAPSGPGEKQTADREKDSEGRTGGRGAILHKTGEDENGRRSWWREYYSDGTVIGSGEKIKNSDGSVTERRSDGNNKLTYEAVTSPDGRKTSWTEYESGKISQRGEKNVNPDGSAEIVTYDPSGRVTSRKKIQKK